MTYLRSKQQERLKSGSNIKTINGESILGSGNLTISGGAGSVPVGTIVLIYNDEIEDTGTNSRTVKSYTLSENTFSQIMVEAEVEFINKANSNGNTSFNIVIDSVTKRTLILSGDATGTGDQFQSGGTAKYSEPMTRGAIIEIITTSVSNATWKVFSLRVYGIY